MLFKKKIVAVLGSTGSIGKLSLNIFQKYKKKFKIDLLSCNKDKKSICAQIKKYKPKYVIINDKKTFNYFLKRNSKKILFFNNLKDFNKNISFRFDITILAISGYQGLEYAFFFNRISKKMLVANKESIICGGSHLLNEAKLHNCKIKSIDSELFCLDQIINSNNINDIKFIYLTASGGPFLKKKIKSVSNIHHAKALKHPKWKMGKKISIDSATLSNKIFEIMETSILFNINPNKIKIKIHEESKIHAIVVFNNNLIKMVAHNTSMKIPIENAIFENKFVSRDESFFNSKKPFNFSFDEINLKKFKILQPGWKAIKLGPRAYIFFNVLNDYLVDLYLKDKIFFYQISNKLNNIFNNKFLSKILKKPIKNKNDIFKTIVFSQEYCKKI